MADNTGLPRIGAPTRRTTDHIAERIQQIKADPSANKQISVGIQDHDEAVIYHIRQNIIPTVDQNENQILVPIRMANSELWDQIQNDGYCRDENGKLLFPIIVIKRVSIEKNREMGHKLDGNNVNVWRYFEKEYSSRNQYINTHAPSNTIPEKEIIAVANPDYINIKYEGFIQSNFTAHTNKIIEQLLYASDSYWGDSKTFRFLSKIESFDNSTEMDVEQERISTSTFSINVSGYLIPDIKQRNIGGVQNIFSPMEIKFGVETKN